MTKLTVSRHTSYHFTTKLAEYLKCMQLLKHRRLSYLLPSSPRSHLLAEDSQCLIPSHRALSSPTGMTLKQGNKCSKSDSRHSATCLIHSLFSTRRQGCGGIEQIPLRRPSLNIGVSFAPIDRTRGATLQIANVNISMI